MIIFDLDGTLADCEHRRYFVDPSKNPDYTCYHYNGFTGSGSKIANTEYYRKGSNR